MLSPYVFCAQVAREEAELAALNAKEAAELAAATPAAVEPDAEEDAEEDEAAQRAAISMLHCCRNVDEYERVSRISEGTYGIVFKCALELMQQPCACKVHRGWDLCSHTAGSIPARLVETSAPTECIRAASGNVTLSCSEICTGGQGSAQAALCRAKEKATGRLCALKKVKLDTRKDREGFPLTALREVRVGI